MVLLSVHQTQEGDRTSLHCSSSQFKRLRDILGMKHCGSICDLDAKISWNAFNGIVTFWVITTVFVWMCRLELELHKHKS